ncbi:MAG: hypothetical protein IJ544_02725, partial [Prevotella sp.]|nr:hypothetical protein [Prevotella sp.]
AWRKGYLKFKSKKDYASSPKRWGRRIGFWSAIFMERNFRHYHMASEIAQKIRAATMRSLYFEG